MQALRPELVAIHQEVLADAHARRRMERMLSRIRCADIREVDDAGLAALARERWLEFPRCGELSRQCDPDIAFTSWRFHVNPWQEDDDAPARRARQSRYPELMARGLDGFRGLSWRNDGDRERMRGSVCTSAWELHSIVGCPFHCAYCGCGATLINIGCNIEDLVASLDKWTGLNRFQNRYEFYRRTLSRNDLHDHASMPP